MWTIVNVDNCRSGQLYKRAKGWLLVNGIPTKHPKIEPFLEGIPIDMWRIVNRVAAHILPIFYWYTICQPVAHDTSVVYEKPRPVSLVTHVTINNILYISFFHKKCLWSR
jgi:hypothetical protein